MLRPCVVTPDTLPEYGAFLPTELTEEAAAMLLLGLEENGVPCGLLSGKPEGDVFALRSLYVAPTCRRRGGGLRLLEVLLAVLEDDPSLRSVRCEWKADAEPEGLAPMLLGAGFVPAPAEDGLTAAEFTLTPTEDLGYLLADMGDD